MDALLANINPHSRFTDEIDRFGLRWHLEAQYDVSKTDPSRRIQVRESEHYAPKENVKTFAYQMGQSPNFPPIVVTADNWIVDGNTRVGARIYRKDKFTPAIMIDVVYSTMSKNQKIEMEALAATFNQLGGQRLTRQEVVEMTKKLVGLGWTGDKIAKAIGAPQSVVNSIKRQQAGAKKLSKVGLSATAFDDSSLKVFGNEALQRLNDVPFKELATLHADAGLKSAETIDFAKKMKEFGDDTLALDYLRQMRNENALRIRDHQVSGQSQPSPAARLRQALGAVTRFAGQEKELIEMNDSAVNNHIVTIEQSITILKLALEYQNQVKPKES